MFSCSQPKLIHLAAVASFLAASTSAFSQQRSECDAGSSAQLFETVYEPTTHVPLMGATVTASWRENGEHSIKLRTDSAGKVLVCAPPDRVITLRASYRKILAPPQTAMLTLARPTTQVLSVDVPVVLVRGTIVDDVTGAPVPQVAVRIVNTPLSVLSDPNGKFYFERVPLGDYTMHVEHIAYARYDAPLAVELEDLDATIRLAPSAIPLKALTVVAFSQRLEIAGFYDRQKRGIGTFLTHKELDKLNAQFGSDLLRSIPSMLQVPQPSRRNAPRNYTIGRSNCRFRFIVDGTRTMPDFQMDNIAPYTVEGIEIYNGLSEIPAVFRPAVDSGAGTCGVIAVWTKDGR